MTNNNKPSVLNIYSVDGELVYNTKISDGFTWFGTDNNGKELPTGVYIVRVKKGDLVVGQKIVIQR